jgi:hypothetical protein
MILPSYISQCPIPDIFPTVYYMQDIWNNPPDRKSREEKNNNHCNITRRIEGIYELEVASFP